MTIKSTPPDTSKFEPWMIEKARALFADGESITSVCCDLDITRQTYYNWRDDSEHPFSVIAKKGELLSQQFWERLGKHGIAGNIDKFGGSSWQFVMKNRFREHYADQQKEKEGNTAVEMLLTMLAESKK